MKVPVQSRRRRSGRAGDESGVALVIALTTLSLLLALGVALALTTATETRIAAHFRDGVEALYAADAGVDRAIRDLATTADWDSVLAGTTTSSFNDGPPTGLRLLPDGSTLDLTRATGAMRCGRDTCSAGDLTATSEDRAWGANNPVWQPYAYGPLRSLSADTIDSHMYVIVWIADDPSENDDNPLRDGAPPVDCDVEKDPSCANDNVGRGRIVMRAQALGPDGIQRTIDVTIARAGETDVRIVSWREIR